MFIRMVHSVISLKTLLVLYDQASRSISMVSFMHYCTSPQPINVVVFNKPSRDLIGPGDLILGQVSRLDAFSGYPFRTWLPGSAIG